MVQSLFSTQYAWFEAFFLPIRMTRSLFPPNTHGSKSFFHPEYAWFKAFFHPIRMVQSLFPPNMHGSKPFSTQYAWFKAFFLPIRGGFWTGCIQDNWEQLWKFQLKKKKVQEHVPCTYQKDNERSHL
jgi:hypothetical protein